MKKSTIIYFIAVVATLLSLWGCGYRLVDPISFSDLLLGEIKNTTPEPQLQILMEESLRSIGIVEGKGKTRLFIAITGFKDRVDSISSTGTTIRQRISMDFFWRVGEEGSSESTFGEESVSLSYPYSSDLTILDWNRKAALKQLTGEAAGILRYNIGNIH